MHAEKPVWQKELIVRIISRRFQEVFKNKFDFMMLATGFKTKNPSRHYNLLINACGYTFILVFRMHAGSQRSQE